LSPSCSRSPQSTTQLHICTHHIVLALFPSKIYQVPEDNHICINFGNYRFGYRGLQLDIARNFQPKEVILEYLTVMATYQLNTLHLRLADDEGWRIFIEDVPELTEVDQIMKQFCVSKTKHRGHCERPLSFCSNWKSSQGNWLKA